MICSMDEDMTGPESTSLYGELRERLRFETLIADLSSIFVNLPAADMDREIMQAQRLFCELLGLDLAGFWQWSDEVGSFRLTHLYRVDQGPEPPEPMIARDHFPWFEQQMLAGRTVAVSSMEQLPAEAARDRQVYGHFGIKSVLAIPLSVGGAAPLGMLSFNSTRAARDWPNALMKRLQLVAQIFANALARKRADEELREIADLNRATFDQAAVGIAHVGTDGRWLHVNDRLCAILGYPREELLRLTFQDITHPEDLAMGLHHVRQLLSGEIKTFSTEKRYLRKDRSLVWAHLTVSLVRTAAGEPRHFIAIVEDITDRKHAEDETRELRDNLTHLARVNTLGALSGSLAHELNQPLGIILSNAQAAQELLAREPPDVAEVQSILTDIVAADRHAGEVIGRLREMLKRGEVSLRPLLLNEIIEEVLRLAQSDLIARGVTVVRDLAADLPPIAGDRVQLQQLVLNLLLNGADAMAGKESNIRRIHAQTRLHQSRVQASIRDEGVGLPADVDRLFQPFYTTRPDGLGLGLSICQAIVCAHHGRLWAEPHPDGGAVFRFELPVAASPVNS